MGSCDSCEKIDLTRFWNWQVLAAVLGVAGDPPLGISASKPHLFFVSRANDRPAGPQQAIFSLSYTLRNDFAAAFDTVMENIHTAGCQFPIFSPVSALPLLNGAVRQPMICCESWAGHSTWRPRLP